MFADRHFTAIGIFKTFVITVLLLATMIFGAGYVYVNQAGGLRRLLETELSHMVGNGSAAVGDARLTFALSSHPLQLVVENIVINLERGQIDLPDVEIGFGLTSLFGGRPETILLRGIKLDLVKKASGWSGSPAIIFLDQLAKQSNQLEIGKPRSGPIQNRLGGMKSIAIETDRLSLSHENGALPKLVFGDIHIDVTSDDDGAVAGSLRARRLASDDAAAGSFTLSFDGWPGSDSFAFDMSASDLNTADISGYIDRLPVALRQIGILSGHLGLEMTDDLLTKLNADVALVDGMLGIPGIGRDAAFDTADLVFSYSRPSDSLMVSKAALNFADQRRLSFNGAVNQFHASSASVKGMIEANNLPIQSLLDGWPDPVAPDLKQTLRQRFNGGQFKFVKAEFQGAFVSETSALTLSSLGLESQFAGVRANFASGQFQRLVATIGGALGMNVGKGGQIQDVLVDLDMTDGSMLLAGYERSVDLASGQLKSVLRGDVATLENLAFDMGSAGKFNLGGRFEIGDNWTLRDLQLDLNVPDMDAVLFSALWPQWAAPETGAWIAENIPAGRVRDSKLSFAADLGAAKGVRKVYDVEGDIKLRNAELIWAKGATPITNIDADLYWNNDAFTASFLTGRIDDIALQRGRIVIEPVLDDIQKNAMISLNAKGAASTAMDLARQAGLSQYGSFDFSKIKADGEIEFSLEAALPLGKQGSMANRIQKLDATISNGSFRNLPNQMNVDDAELVVDISTDNSQITGTATIYGAPSEFSLEIDHQKRHVELIGQTPPSSLLATAIAKIFDLDIAGSIGGKIVYSGDPSMNEAKIGMTVDLSSASINVPKLNWAKLPAEDGRVTMTILLRKGEVASLQNIDMAAGSLSAQGQVAFDRTGQIQAAFFERVAWPGNDVRDLIIERNAESSWKVGATARLVNLVPLRRNEGVSGDETLIFDFTADQIVVDNEISLSGQLSGNRTSDGMGKAKFLGTMLVDGAPLITEADLEMGFGINGDKIVGTGLIGGGEVNLTFAAKIKDDPKLVIESENAGRVLSGLKVTDTVRGGQLRLTNIFKDNEFKSFDTKIELTKFRIVEAPRALRAFSVLSLAGLYSLVEGDGTAFQRGEAVLETRGPMVKIVSMKASGEAVGVTMLGVYDRATKKVDVSGNLVPVNQISKLLGKVPVLGDLFAGVDKSGIFVSQFTVTGTSDDMTTAVNPVSSIAPGLLRDLFSPNWLGREEKRLFGDGRAATAPAP
ncbi:AsmA-like C-terminal domain-containing protein [Alphaproteobacteria bacterium]|nr:AsmA-like C-terminal domain-containing protein [Alphaproteobacteria bacterium]